jgi:hypothetical protein
MDIHAFAPPVLAVIPGLIKGRRSSGGGQYGQGVVTCRTGHGWSAPVFIRDGEAAPLDFKSAASRR